jgi:aconitate hydratase
MPGPANRNSFGALSQLKLRAGHVGIFRLEALEEKGFGPLDRLPVSIRILLEQALRSEDGKKVTDEDVKKLAGYDPRNPQQAEIPFLPARVLMQDFTGVPAVVDLAALRSALADLGRDPLRINPLIPVDLVIDHSVQVDAYGTPDALRINAEREFDRNRERYEFLHWGQKAFRNFRVIPPASGICHQVNLEYLAKVVQRRRAGDLELAFPDTLVGTDSHTTMINGLGVLGWGVGGIEAEAAMLGQPVYMLLPDVVGFKVVGALPPGATATDLVLTVTQILRAHGVVGKFVEFFGPGLSALSLPDRATIANMAPEYGATCALFPVDAETLHYLRCTGRNEAELDLVERYCKEQGLFREERTPEPVFREILELDLSTVEPSLSGPKRPQDRIPLSRMKAQFREDLTAPESSRGFHVGADRVDERREVRFPDGTRGTLKHGDVVIAAITSCTNTSNPAVMIGAGVLARKAVEAGLTVRPHVKTSLAPGSNVVRYYLEESGLMPALEKLGFHIVGFGCTTCIGNSGPLPEHILEAVEAGRLVTANVLSGNRNFEGRIHPHSRASYLASPPLVVAYALAGTVNIDLTAEPLGTGRDGRPVFLKDLWPTEKEIQSHLAKASDPEAFRRIYAGILTGNDAWNAIPSTDEAVFDWKPESTYIQQPPFFVQMTETARPIGPVENARVLVMLGDSVTTDHISPAGSFDEESEAGKYLVSRGVSPDDFNSFGSRRGNDRVMTRGTFANIRLRNRLAPDTEGGWTPCFLSGEVVSIYEASQRYREEGVPVIVLAGKDYGMGSSRDWAAKGTYLLGVRAVIAESFERIHRSNLVGMGVLPLQFLEGESAKSLGLTGRETFFVPTDDALQPLQKIRVRAVSEDGAERSFTVTCRIDTPIEIDYYRNGGILHTVLRDMTLAPA